MVQAASQLVLKLLAEAPTFQVLLAILEALDMHDEMAGLALVLPSLGEALNELFRTGLVAHTNGIGVVLVDGVNRLGVGVLLVDGPSKHARVHKDDVFGLGLLAEAAAGQCLALDLVQPLVEMGEAGLHRALHMAQHIANFVVPDLIHRFIPGKLNAHRCRDSVSFERSPSVGIALCLLQHLDLGRSQDITVEGYNAFTVRSIGRDRTFQELIRSLLAKGNNGASLLLLLALLVQGLLVLLVQQRLLLTLLLVPLLQGLSLLLRILLLVLRQLLLILLIRGLLCAARHGSQLGILPLSLHCRKVEERGRRVLSVHLVGIGSDRMGLGWIGSGCLLMVCGQLLMSCSKRSENLFWSARRTERWEEDGEEGNLVDFEKKKLLR